MPVQAVDEGLDGRFVEVTEIAGTLAGLLAKHQGLGVDQSERVDDDLALDGLDGIDDYRDGAGCELLEGLLGLDID